MLVVNRCMKKESLQDVAKILLKTVCTALIVYFTIPN